MIIYRVVSGADQIPQTRDAVSLALKVDFYENRSTNSGDTTSMYYYVSLQSRNYRYLSSPVMATLCGGLGLVVFGRHPILLLMKHLKG